MTGEEGRRADADRGEQTVLMARADRDPQDPDYAAAPLLAHAHGRLAAGEMSRAQYQRYRSLSWQLRVDPELRAAVHPFFAAEGVEQAVGVVAEMFASGTTLPSVIAALRAKGRQAAD